MAWFQGEDLLIDTQHTLSARNEALWAGASTNALCDPLPAEMHIEIRQALNAHEEFSVLVSDSESESESERARARERERERERELLSRLQSLPLLQMLCAAEGLDSGATVRSVTCS